MTIQTLYGPVDNMKGFVHPTYGRTGFLTDQQVVEFAKRIAESIARSGRQKIVVSETGARPLAYICQRLLEGTGVDWKYVKFPREPTADLFPVINHYLTPEEREEKSGELEFACRGVNKDSLELPKRPLSEILQAVGTSRQSEQQRLVSQAIVGTGIAEFVGSPFLYFDEYVDSGATLQNANMYFNYLSGSVDFRTVSYFTYISNSANFDKVHFTLFDLDSQEASFRQGAYPFENRLDLIGYFYFIEGSVYRRITLEDMRRKSSSKNRNAASALVTDIQRTIRNNRLLPRYQSNFSVPAVRQFMDEDHLARQVLMTLEEAVKGRGVAHEFLWQLADMYGPVWSPMPKANHLDFFDGTKRRRGLIEGVKDFERLKQDYAQAREEVLSQAATACLQRKKAWYKRIDELLEVN